MYYQIHVEGFEYKVKKCFKKSIEIVKSYIKLILLLIPMALLGQTKVQDTIMIGLSIPELFFLKKEMKPNESIIRVE